MPTSTSSLSIPSGLDDEVTFVSGIAASATLAATSYWTWNRQTIPATYGAISQALKWGNPTLSASGTPGGNVSYWFDPGSKWTADEKKALQSGLALWSAEANISFSLAGDAATAQATFTRLSPGGNTSGRLTGSAFRSVGSGSEGQGLQGTVSIDTSTLTVGTSFTAIGSNAWETILHEIGHMIGLGHAGAYDGKKVDKTQQQFSPYDSRLWSLMSYVYPTETNAKFYGAYPVAGTAWGGSGGFAYQPTTPMIVDVAAAQRIYGSATSGPLASGGQIFGFHSNIAGLVGQFFDFTVNTHPVVTIWDGGHNNTLDLSGFAANAAISLVPGTFTSVNGEVNNIGIALGTVIEKAIGGSGSDTITGTEVDNVLDGADNNDTLKGVDGNDILIGGAGADALVGGAGIDRAQYSDSTGGLTVDLSVSSANTGIAAGDSYSSIENLYGSNFNDSLRGNSGANTIWGAAGNDTILGGDGNDALEGGDGNDILIGGAGADALVGGAGIDRAQYSDSTGGLTVDLSVSSANTGIAAGDSYSSIENLYGSNFNDSLRGNSGANTIWGGASKDTILGRDGNDTLTGGAGKDTFIFDAALNGSTNVDHITDFSVADDTIRLENSVFTALTTLGLLQSASFFVGSAAHDMGDRVIYNATTGALLYDTDGSSAGGAIQFATLSTGLALTHSDFVII